MFEALPVEVHESILRGMTPEGVYMTIQASPKALQAFILSREEILIYALRSGLSPPILVELLGLLRVQLYDVFQPEEYVHIAAR